MKSICDKKGAMSWMRMVIFVGVSLFMMFLVLPGHAAVTGQVTDTAAIRFLEHW